MRASASVRVHGWERGNVSVCLGDKSIWLDVQSVSLSLRAFASVGVLMSASARGLGVCECARGDLSARLGK